MMSLINNTGEWRMRLRNDWDSVLGVIRYPRESENGEWRMRLQNDWDSVLGVIRYPREWENGEWRMRLRNDWDSVLGVIRLYRETENGEWRTVAQQLSILLSPFSFLHLVISPTDFYRHPMNITLFMVRLGIPSRHN